MRATEVHAISQVFTGAIYDILADIFAFTFPADESNSETALLHQLVQTLTQMIAQGR